MTLCFYASENRLKKLEGRDGQLTSKDMLSALSQARDDHLSRNTEPSSNGSSFINDSAERWEWEDSDVRDGGFVSTYCCWCGGRGYLRGRRGEFKIEEYSCLLDCDELELSSNENTTSPVRLPGETQQSAYDDQPVASTGDTANGFTDNFVS